MSLLPLSCFTSFITTIYAHPLPAIAYRPVPSERPYRRTLSRELSTFLNGALDRIRTYICLLQLIPVTFLDVRSVGGYQGMNISRKFFVKTPDRLNGGLCEIRTHIAGLSDTRGRYQHGFTQAPRLPLVTSQQPIWCPSRTCYSAQDGHGTLNWWNREVV